MYLFYAPVSSARFPVQKCAGSRDSKPAVPSSSKPQGPAAQITLPRAPHSSPSPHLPSVLSGLERQLQTPTCCPGPTHNPHCPRRRHCCPGQVAWNLRIQQRKSTGRKKGP